MKDYIRLEEARDHILSAFDLIDNIENTTLFNVELEGIHNNLDVLGIVMTSLCNDLTEQIGKEAIDAYLSAISK